LLAEIYLWLRQAFDPSDDPQHHGNGFSAVTPRDEVGRWRDRLLLELRDKGTAGAIEALVVIGDALPGAGWLQQTQAAAMTAFSRKAWQGHSIRDLITVARRPETSLVNTEFDLSAVVKNAFGIIQSELTGANPQSHLLWDTHSRRPKAEDEISDHLRNRLADLTSGNGLVINREVQVRRNQPSGIPERADIQVDAATGVAGPLATITLPIEVKGAWHVDLMTAMRAQLVEMYMSDLHASRGCYLVLWPDTENWTESDPRRRDVDRRDRANVIEQLAAQAEELRSEGYVVDVIHLGIEYRRPIHA
jgi:hypothetical protein